ncbi:hypothetical protein AB0K48_33485, partial [Nonomuraea sp. NPDC055795]
RETSVGKRALYARRRHGLQGAGQADVWQALGVQVLWVAVMLGLGALGTRLIRHRVVIQGG